MSDQRVQTSYIEFLPTPTVAMNHYFGQASPPQPLPAVPPNLSFPIMGHEISVLKPACPPISLPIPCPPPVLELPLRLYQILQQPPMSFVEEDCVTTCCQCRQVNTMLDLRMKDIIRRYKDENELINYLRKHIRFQPIPGSELPVPVSSNVSYPIIPDVCKNSTFNVDADEFKPSQKNRSTKTEITNVNNYESAINDGYEIHPHQTVDTNDLANAATESGMDSGVHDSGVSDSGILDSNTIDSVPESRIPDGDGASNQDSRRSTESLHDECKIQKRKSKKKDKRKKRSDNDHIIPNSVPVVELDFVNQNRKPMVDSNHNYKPLDPKSSHCSNNSSSNCISSNSSNNNSSNINNNSIVEKPTNERVLYVSNVDDELSSKSAPTPPLQQQQQSQLSQQQQHHHHHHHHHPQIAHHHASKTYSNHHHNHGGGGGIGSRKGPSQSSVLGGGGGGGGGGAAIDKPPTNGMPERLKIGCMVLPQSSHGRSGSRSSVIDSYEVRSSQSKYGQGHRGERQPHDRHLDRHITAKSTNGMGGSDGRKFSSHARMRSSNAVSWSSEYEHPRFSTKRYENSQYSDHGGSGGGGGGSGGGGHGGGHGHGTYSLSKGGSSSSSSAAAQFVSSPMRTSNELEKQQQQHLDKCVVREVPGDLFEAPSDYSLAHCVAEDLRMSAGIAVQFRKEFKGVEELRSQCKAVGEVAFLKKGDRYIYYMITKSASKHKPKLYNVQHAIRSLRELCEQHNVTKLALPAIGSGLDRLDWNDVKHALNCEFQHTNIDVVVYHLKEVSSPE